MSLASVKNRREETWDSVELNSCFELQNGVNFSSEQKGRGLLIVDVLNMYSDDIYVRTDRLYRVDIDVPQDRLLRPGDVLFVRSSVKQSGVGWPAIFKGHEEPVTNCGFLIRARQTKERVDPKFFVHYLRQEHVRAQMISRSGKVAITNINQERLGSLRIPLPPLPEQKRIAEILDRAEALRAKRRAALAQLDTLTESIFLDLFGDPASNPKKWPTAPLRELSSKFSDGPFGSNLKSEHYVQDGVRVVRLQNIGVGEFVDNDKAFISERHFSRLSKHECKPGDVLVGTLGEPNLRACIQPGWLSVALNKADCVQVRPNENVASAQYICSLLNHPSTEKMAHDLMHGQTRIRISMGRLRELIVPIPPVDLQREFAHRVAAVEKLKAAHRQSLAELDALFASLQHRAFRGEL